MKVNLRMDDRGDYVVWATKNINGRPFMEYGYITSLDRPIVEVREEIKLEATNCINALPNGLG